MKKIMFENRRFGLEQSVIDLQKTMTRRLIKISGGLKPADIWNPVMGIDDKGRVYFTVDCIDSKQRDIYPQYQIGEVVVIAQSTKTCKNKMSVKASDMSHHIKITNIKFERLQDISDEDCSKEGIVPFTWRQWLKQDIEDFSPQKYKDWHVYTVPKFIDSLNNSWIESEPDEFIADSPKVAFYVIIRKLMGQKTWDANPWTFVYEFELVK